MWSIPPQRSWRDPAEVPAKRRAMHRRKIALMAAMPQQLQHLPGSPAQ
jgi:uncharacterized protein VirK/YbjX